ncbi:Hypothetical predicted protein, partial [Paramuricea clavata]
MIYSDVAERNVGKSLTLETIAKAQGIVGAGHPLHCSGGDQTISGVSVKMLMVSWTKTGGIRLHQVFCTCYAVHQTSFTLQCFLHTKGYLYSEFPKVTGVHADLKTAIEHIASSWLNPCVSVCMDDAFVPAIAIKISKTGQFTSVDNKEIKDHIAHALKGEKS